jgi:dolichol-phosphate mannosyltransferase
MNDTLVVVFCYNVEKNIKNLIIKLKKNKIDLKRDILFIDDCSTDKTNKILNSYKINNSIIIKNKKNQGFGLNYKFSIKYSIKNKYKKVIFLHGDNQYPANKVPLLDSLLEKVSLCYGSRRLNFKIMMKNMPKLRLFANLILTIFINFILRNSASEYFSGFRGFRVNKLKKINLKNFDDKWVIEQQIHFYFIKKKYSISEFSIPTIYKKNQISNIPAFYYVLSVLINAFKFSYLKNFSERADRKISDLNQY